MPDSSDPQNPARLVNLVSALADLTDYYLTNAKAKLCSRISSQLRGGNYFNSS
jgi:hypothetical protein